MTNFTCKKSGQLLLLIGCSLIRNIASSQTHNWNNERGHALQFITGSANVTDSFISATKMKGTTYGGVYSYYMTNARRRTSVIVQGSTTEYYDTVKMVRGNSIRISLNDLYAVSNTPGGKFSLFAGYDISTGVTGFVFNEAGHKLLSWAQTTSLAYYQTARFSWGRQVLSLDVKVPLMSLVSRPADNYDAAKQGNFNSIFVAAYSNAKWTNVFKSPMYSIGLNYDHKIIDRLLLHLQYQYDYQKITTSKVFVNSSTAVGVGLKYVMK